MNHPIGRWLLCAGLLTAPMAAAVTPACEFNGGAQPCVQLCGDDRVPTIMGHPIADVATGTCSDARYTDKATCEASASCSNSAYTTQATCLGATGLCSDPAHTTQATCLGAVGTCSNTAHTTQAACTGAGTCTDKDNNTTAHTTQAACTAAGICTKGQGGGTAIKFTNRLTCEAAHKCTPPGTHVPDPDHCCADLASSQSACTTDATCTGCGWHAKAHGGMYWNANAWASDNNTWTPNTWTPTTNTWAGAAWTSDGKPNKQDLADINFNQLANWSVRCDCRPGTQEVYYDATTKLMTLSPTSSVTGKCVINGAVDASYTTEAGCEAPAVNGVWADTTLNPRAGTCTSEAVTYSRPKAECGGSQAPFVFACPNPGSMMGTGVCSAWTESDLSEACLTNDPPCAGGYAKDGSTCNATPLTFTTWPPPKVAGTTLAPECTVGTVGGKYCPKRAGNYGLRRQRNTSGSSDEGKTYGFHEFPDPHELPAPRCPTGSLNTGLIPDANGECDWVIPADKVHSEWKKNHATVLSAATVRFSTPEQTYASNLTARYPRIDIPASLLTTMAAERQTLEETYQSVLMADDKMPDGNGWAEAGRFDDTVFPNRHVKDIRPTEWYETDKTCPTGFTVYQDSCRATIKAPVNHPAPKTTATLSSSVLSGFTKYSIFGTHAPDTEVGKQIVKCNPAPYGRNTAVTPAKTYTTGELHYCTKWQPTCYSGTEWINNVEYCKDSGRYCLKRNRCTETYTKYELTCTESTVTSLSGCPKDPGMGRDNYTSCAGRPTGDGTKSPQEYWYMTSENCTAY